MRATCTGLDQSFRTLIQGLMGMAVYTISSLLKSIHLLMRSHRIKRVLELHCVWDFQAWLEPFAAEFGNFATTQFSSGMNKFEFYKDAAGEVRCICRQSCLSSTYFPEGGGYQVFKEDPTGEPFLKQLKPDSFWQRDQVEVGVRKHFSYFRCGPEEYHAAVAEWETRFKSLTGGNVDVLPSEKKLRWRPLPARGYNAVVATGHIQGSGLDEIENPEVNPLVTATRSRADREADVRRWEAHLIARHSYFMDRGLPYPLFAGLEQPSYYLFQGIQTAGVPCNNYHYPDSLDFFVVCGFRQLVERKDILVYDVTMFQDGDGWRIHTSALKQLAELVPEFAFPDTLPASHQVRSASQTARGSGAGGSCSSSGGRGGQAGNAGRGGGRGKAGDRAGDRVNGRAGCRAGGRAGGRAVVARRGSSSASRDSGQGDGGGSAGANCAACG
eukprot:5847881-Pleurochrysis_carterae.AAC.3